MLAPLGVLAISVNGFFVSFVLGGLGARFRDVPLICANLMQVAFFLSPVFWQPTRHSEHVCSSISIHFTIFSKLVRMPLMGQIPPATIWLVIAAITCVNAIDLVLFLRPYSSANCVLAVRGPDVTN